MYIYERCMLVAKDPHLGGSVVSPFLQDMDREEQQILEQEHKVLQEVDQALFQRSPFTFTAGALLGKITFPFLVTSGLVSNGLMPAILIPLLSGGVAVYADSQVSVDSLDLDSVRQKRLLQKIESIKTKLLSADPNELRELQQAYAYFSSSLREAVLRKSIDNTTELSVVSRAF